MADADAAEAVGAAYMPVAPPLVLPDAAVPPPMAAETVVTLPPVAADAVEAAVAAMSAVLLPPPPEQMSQSVMGGGEEECLESEIHESQSVMSGGEECLEGEIHEAFESIEVLISSLADNQKPCDMMGYITERNECEQDIESLPVLLDIEGGESLEIPSISSSIDPKSYLKKLPEVTVPALGHLLEEEQPAMAISDNSKESEKQIPPPPPCPSEEQQKPKDDGDLSADSPTNSSDGSDQSDGEHHHHHYNIPIYSPYNYDPYRLMHRRERRNHWNDDYPFMYGFRDPWHPMTSLHIDDHWSRWPSPEPDQRKKRYNSGSCWSWPSPEPDCEKESYTVGAGLSNPRFWTCFLNCVLQCMVHTVPLVLKLRKADHPDPCPRVSIGFCCYCSLKQHVDESIRLSGSSFYPEIFVNCLKSISSDFKSGVQQDAQEFLRCLLDKLDEDSIAPRSSEESSSTEEGSVVKEIFRGCLKSQLRCPECNHCSDKSEPFLDLSLDLNMVETLMDALQSFTNTELIKDFMCDGCKSRVNMEKHFKIEQAPEVLVIHLKRFTNSESKIWDKVKYPLELDINSFMSSSDDTLQKYDLYGVVEHLGAYGSGHYVCYIRSSEADWYKFNDDKVNKCSVASALESTAYLLFYVKQGSSPWFSTLLEKEDKCPLAGSVSLEEQGEIALVNKEEEATSSHGQGNGNGPTLPDLSEQLQGNGNGNTLSVASDKLEEGCRLGETSAGTQGPSCLIGSGYKNGHADGCWEPSCKMKDVSPRGSQDRKEMKPIACGSLGVEVDHAVTQGGSPRKNENNCHLLQLSHKHKDNCDSLEVDHAVTQGGSPEMNENNCHLLQHPHERNDKFCHRSLSLQDEIRGCCGVLSMGIGTSGSENERVESISNNELGDDNRGTTTKGGGEERRGRGGGESTKRKSADGGESKASRKRRKTKHCTLARHFALCRWSAVAGTLGKGGGEECSGRGGGESKKRKCADGGESKASRKRRKRKQSTVARHFALCRRWRAVASTGGKSKTRRR